MSFHGIDISYAQGNIDWLKVANDPNVDFVIIRATATYPHNGKKGIDLQWYSNIEKAEQLGIPIGAYHYSYAVNVEQARLEAEHFLNIIKGHKFEYPVIFDFEDPCQAKLSKKEMIDICDTWLSIVEKAGYKVALYSMASWFKFYLDDPRLNKYDKWVAHVNVKEPMVQGEMWQYSWKGRINGIVGDVDLNHCYVNYPKMIREQGLNGFEKPSDKCKECTELKKHIKYLEDKLLLIQDILDE